MTFVSLASSQRALAATRTSMTYERRWRGLGSRLWVSFGGTSGSAAVHPSQTRGREPAVTDASLVAICEDLDVASIIGAGTELVVPASVPGSFERAHVTIGVPLDAAFSFYYRSNIEALEHSARLEYFSPLNERLPAVDGLYMGGGFPEARIHQLSANTALLNDIYVKAAEGMPIVAEGGGLVYLSRSLAVNDGALYKLAGVIPAEVRMTDNLQAIGHSEVEIVQDCAIAGCGNACAGTNTIIP